MADRETEKDRSDLIFKVIAGTFIVLIGLFILTCLIVGILGLWHLAFGWP